MRIVERLRARARNALYEWQLYGGSAPRIAMPFLTALDRLRFGTIGKYVSRSRRIQGWLRGAEAPALAQMAYDLPDNAVIVEVGTFLGCSTVLLAGAREVRRSGLVHCVDPFDASGDAFSAPVYRRIASNSRRSLRERFERNITNAGLREWIRIHEGPSTDIAAHWNVQIDMLFLDGDQSYAGALDAYRMWTPFLKRGGVIAVHNSCPRYRQPDHDGSSRIVEEFIHVPAYTAPHWVGSISFARKSADDPTAQHPIALRAVQQQSNLRPEKA
jgi:predicted O-methyltransferase YrrM